MILGTMLAMVLLATLPALVLAPPASAQELLADTGNSEARGPGRAAAEPPVPATTLPDLVPVPDSTTDVPPGDPVSFCRRDPLTGGLVVEVANQGTAEMPESTTTVTFFPGGFVPLTTPSLGPGESTFLGPIDIPPESADPDVDFSIVVDSNSQATELDEPNNTAVGLCIG